jgi:Na+/H+ antiporter NhaD/arsenite permease-like protein
MSPSLVWVFPFAALLAAIAVLPLLESTEAWWHKNRNKLLVSLAASAPALAYYWLRGYGFPHEGHLLEPGVPTVLGVLDHAVLKDFIPFIVILLSLFTISGGIHISGSFVPRPLTNTLVLAIGGLIASFVGTTGASILLIRPLLKINRARTYKVHTFVFFIFIVSNIGGCLLPIGDPPLFLGFLRGVPFGWTFNLAREWAFTFGILLAVYLIWETAAWYREPDRAALRHPETKERFRIRGAWNFVLLFAVILTLAMFVRGKYIFPFGIKQPHLPLVGLREYILLALAAFSMLFTSKEIRRANEFSFFAIHEVACLFIGLFITMQIPIEILNVRGPELGLSTPLGFFWATGLLSSVLDNAPTYVVFFQTAGTLPWPHPNQMLYTVQTSSGSIAAPLLAAVSCGAVFMGAMTYIGNAPNFMVKSIAEQSGVKMPSFFGFLLYSMGILIPLFILVSYVFHV